MFYYQHDSTTITIDSRKKHYHGFTKFPFNNYIKSPYSIGILVWCLRGLDCDCLESFSPSMYEYFWDPQ